MRHRLLGAIAGPMIFLAQCAPGGCAPALPSFGSGTLRVGTDVQPGIYVSLPGAQRVDCYWQRLSGPDANTDTIVRSLKLTPTHEIVEIEPTDYAFTSSPGCGGWQLAGPRTPSASITQGDWQVGVDMAPGRWRANTFPAGICGWELASGFTHENGEITAAGSSTDRVVVDIASTDVRFTSGSDCGTWTLTGPATEPSGTYAAG